MATNRKARGIMKKLDFLKLRIIAAYILLIASCIFWPISAFTWAKDEPTFVLSLSWAAIVLTAIDILSTQDVRKEQ